MAFNVNNFRSKFEQYGGAARVSLFTVEIYRPDKKDNIKISTSDLRFFCKTVTFPGINLETYEHKPYGVGLPVRMPSGISSQDLNAVFLLDSSHQVMGFFHSWLQDVYNYRAHDLGAANLHNANQAVYELGYHNDYTCNILIKFYSAHDPDSYYECLLENAYPTQVGQVELSWDSDNQIAQLPVNFAFDRINFSGAASGPIRGIDSRGFGLLSYITAIGELGQTIDSIRKPRSVQDAVNMFTNIAYTWDNIRNLF